MEPVEATEEDAVAEELTEVKDVPPAEDTPVEVDETA
jgi:hypothetical protein